MAAGAGELPSQVSEGRWARLRDVGAVLCEATVPASPDVLGPPREMGTVQTAI